MTVKKEITLKTKRLLLRPMPMGRLEQKIQEDPDPEMRKAYGEMRDLCLKDPEEYLWAIPWEMILKSNQTPIGDLCFKGTPKKGTVELGYGLEKEYEGQGLMTEAVGAMLDWAFAQENVYAVEAETAPDNLASQRILEKHKFTPCGQGVEGPRFRREKPVLSWLTVYLCFGLSIGSALGSLMTRPILGMLAGMAAAACLGIAMDAAEKKRRAVILGEEKKNDGMVR